MPTAQVSGFCSGFCLVPSQMEKPAVSSSIALNEIDDEDQSAFICPGTMEFMEDPVITADGNINYS